MCSARSGIELELLQVTLNRPHQCKNQAIELPIIEIVRLGVCFYSHHTTLLWYLHMCANIASNHVDKRPMNEFAFGVVKVLPLMIIKMCFCALNFN